MTPVIVKDVGLALFILGPIAAYSRANGRDAIAVNSVLASVAGGLVAGSVYVMLLVVAASFMNEAVSVTLLWQHLCRYAIGGGLIGVSGVVAQYLGYRNSGGGP